MLLQSKHIYWQITNSKSHCMQIKNVCVCCRFATPSLNSRYPMVYTLRMNYMAPLLTMFGESLDLVVGDHARDRVHGSTVVVGKRIASPIHLDSLEHGHIGQ